MKAIHLLKKILVITALLGGLSPLLAEAGSLGKSGPLVDKNCSSRLLSDFLEAQGTSSQFFTPVEDYVGWADGGFITFGLVDYAGLANEYIKAQPGGHSLGTKVRGSVIQCALSDGRAKITVALFTTRALGFAQSIADLEANGFDFLNTPTIFGAKAQDVVKSAKAAVGPVTLLTTFTISKPDAGLPDFLDVVNNSANYAPVKLDFRSTTFGTCSDGKTKARLDVHQAASTDEQNILVFSVEKVEVVDAKGGNCVEDAHGS